MTVPVPPPGPTVLMFVCEDCRNNYAAEYRKEHVPVYCPRCGSRNALLPKDDEQ